MPQFLYISRLSYQHCIHACRTATKLLNTYSDGCGTDSNLNNFDPPDPRGVPGGILGGQQFKSPGNVMNCPENQYIFLKPHPTPGGPNGDFRGSKIQVREMSWTAQKINNLFLTPIPPCGWEFWSSKFPKV